MSLQDVGSYSPLFTTLTQVSSAIGALLLYGKLIHFNENVPKAVKFVTLVSTSLCTLILMFYISYWDSISLENLIYFQFLSVVFTIGIAAIIYFLALWDPLEKLLACIGFCAFLFVLSTVAILTLRFSAMKEPYYIQSSSATSSPSITIRGTDAKSVHVHLSARPFLSISRPGPTSEMRIAGFVFGKQVFSEPSIILAPGSVGDRREFDFAQDFTFEVPEESRRLGYPITINLRIPMCRFTGNEEPTPTCGIGPYAITARYSH